MLWASPPLGVNAASNEVGALCINRKLQLGLAAASLHGSFAEVIVRPMTPVISYQESFSMFKQLLFT